MEISVVLSRTVPLHVEQRWRGWGRLSGPAAAASSQPAVALARAVGSRAGHPAPLLSLGTRGQQSREDTGQVGSGDPQGHHG